MITKDILDAVRRIEISTKRLVSNTFAGAYHSMFKGRGMEFDQVREYQYGDDVRFLDWRVTARSRKPYIKTYIEERELTAVIVVDVSASTHFGSGQWTKNSLAAHVAAILAFSAIRNNDQVGLLMVSDRVELFIPPKKGRSHVLRLIREILYFKPQHVQTRLDAGLTYLMQVLHRRSLIFMISDFYQDDLEQQLKMMNKFHEVIAISLSDPREEDLPKMGLVQLFDPETQEQVIVDTSHEKVRAQYARQAKERKAYREKFFAGLSIDHVALSTEGDYVKALSKFFNERQKA